MRWEIRGHFLLERLSYLYDDYVLCMLCCMIRFCVVNFCISRFLCPLAYAPHYSAFPITNKKTQRLQNNKVLYHFLFPFYQHVEETTRERMGFLVCTLLKPRRLLRGKDFFVLEMCPWGKNTYSVEFAISLFIFSCASPNTRCFFPPLITKNAIQVSRRSSEKSHQKWIIG